MSYFSLNVLMFKCPKLVLYMFELKMSNYYYLYVWTFNCPIIVVYMSELSNVLFQFKCPNV